MPPIVLDARTATDHFPGIGRYVVSLASALHHVAPDLELALLHDSTAPAQRLTLPDLPAINCAASPFALQQQWQVRSALNHAGAALYHSAYYLMPYAPGVPAIFTCHDLIPLIYPHYFNAFQRLIYRTAHQVALATTRLAIAVSQSTKNDLLRFFRVRSDRIVVVPEGVDDHFKPPSRAEIERVRRQYALPDRYLLYFGSNKPHKNVTRLIMAVQHLKTELVIGGHWDARYPQAQQLVERLCLQDRVKFIGPVNERDLPALYGGADVFVFPSEYEGFGLPVLEAMACGAPVVCSNRSSLPEVAGEAALLCDPHDVTTLAQTIEQVLTDRNLRAALCARSSDRATQFTWEHTARQTAALYRSCS